jgi:hypothetical protein
MSTPVMNSDWSTGPEVTVWCWPSARSLARLLHVRQEQVHQVHAITRVGRRYGARTGGPPPTSGTLPVTVADFQAGQDHQR